MHHRPEMSRKREVLSQEPGGENKKRRRKVLLCSFKRTWRQETQVQTIVKEMEGIFRRWESSEQSSKKYVKPRTAGYDDLDKLVTTARDKNIPVSGRMIQEQALLYAAELSHEGFSGSNG